MAAAAGHAIAGSPANRPRNQGEAGRLKNGTSAAAAASGAIQKPRRSFTGAPDCCTNFDKRYNEELSICRIYHLAFATMCAFGQVPPGAREQERILNRVTDFARAYVDRLPDFTCVRTTKHLLTASSTMEWKPEATVASELSYYKREEHYLITNVDGAPKNKVPGRTMAKGWYESNGNFGLALREIFDAEVHTNFQWSGWDSLNGKRAYVFSYKVPLADSKSSSDRCVSFIAFKSCKVMKYGYHGLLFIDVDSSDIVRLTITPDDLPASHGRWTQSIDYARGKVGGGDYLLPVADTFETTGAKTLFRNESVYGSYKKFGTESTLIPTMVR
jgi:hypothetical protein